MAITASSRAHDEHRPIAQSAGCPDRAAEVAHDNRGQDIVLHGPWGIDSSVRLFPVGDRHQPVRQLHAIAEEIDRTLARKIRTKSELESRVTPGARWILQDYGDIVIHLFDEKAREYYALEQLWSGARENRLVGRNNAANCQQPLAMLAAALSSNGGWIN